MFPLAYGIAIAIAVATLIGAYWQGRQAGQDACAAASARDEHVTRVASAAAADAAASAIAGIKVRHTTIRQEVEREIQTRTEYRDCRHGPDQLQHLNDALTGARFGATGDGELPGPDTPGR